MPSCQPTPTPQPRSHLRPHEIEGVKQLPCHQHAGGEQHLHPQRRQQRARQQQRDTEVRESAVDGAGLGRGRCAASDAMQAATSQLHCIVSNPTLCINMSQQQHLTAGVVQQPAARPLQQSSSSTTSIQRQRQRTRLWGSAAASGAPAPSPLAAATTARWTATRTRCSGSTGRPAEGRIAQDEGCGIKQAGLPLCPASQPT